MDEWLTAAEVAELIKVHPMTVKRWLREGDMRGTLLGDKSGWRVHRDEVARFMRERDNTDAPARSRTDSI